MKQSAINNSKCKILSVFFALFFCVLNISTVYADEFTPNTTGLTVPFSYYFEAGTTGNVDLVEGENFHKYNDFTYVYKFNRKGSIANKVEFHIPSLSGTNIQVQPYIILVYRHDLNYALAYYVNANTFTYQFPTAGSEFTFYQIYYNPDDYDGVFWYLTDRWLTEIPDLTRQNKFISLNYVYHITDANMPGYTVYNKYTGNLRLPMPVYIDWHNTRGPINTATSSIAGSFTYKTGTNTQYSIATSTAKDNFYYGFASSSDSTTQTPFIITFPSVNYNDLCEYHFSRLNTGTTAPFSLRQYTEVESENPPPADGNISTPSEGPNLGPIQDGIDNSINDLNDFNTSIGENFSDLENALNDIDLNGQLNSIFDSVGLNAATAWITGQMTALFGDLGEFRFLIIFPLTLGVVVAILNGGIAARTGRRRGDDE